MRKLPKPQGDHGEWYPRDENTNKFAANYRNMLHYQRLKAEDELHAALLRRARDPEPGDLQQNLTKQYNKLHSLDHFNEFIIIILFVVYCF